MRLDRNRILVVGGTSGIGAAVARMSSALGADVTTASRRPASIEVPCHAHISLDISEEGEVRERLSGQQAFNHVVVSSGGAKPANIRNSSTEQPKEAFETKFWGAWRVAAFAPLEPDSSITFVSGVFAERPSRGQVTASCVNAALEALARGLAGELGPTRVNVVSPGLVDTPMWHGMPEHKRASFFAGAAESLPAKRICSAEDVAALVLACMTNPALTGSVLKVDGGYTLV